MIKSKIRLIIMHSKNNIMSYDYQDIDVIHNENEPYKIYYQELFDLWKSKDLIVVSVQELLLSQSKE